MRFNPIVKIRPGLWRHSAAIFLAMLVLFYLTQPYFEEQRYGKELTAATFTLVLLTGALAVGDRKRLLILAAVFSATTTLMLWCSHLWPHLFPREYSLVTALLFSIFVSIRLIRFILKAPVVDLEVLCGAVATYLMFALACAFLYILVGLANPQAFAWTVDPGSRHKMEGFGAMYFSLTTQATLGYGDIVPLSPTARLLAMVQAVGGLFYMTLLVARLVSVYSSQHVSGKS